MSNTFTLPLCGVVLRLWPDVRRSQRRKRRRRIRRLPCRSWPWRTRCPCRLAEKELEYTISRVVAGLAGLLLSHVGGGLLDSPHTCPWWCPAPWPPIKAMVPFSVIRPARAPAIQPICCGVGQQGGYVAVVGLGGRSLRAPFSRAKAISGYSCGRLQDGVGVLVAGSIDQVVAQSRSRRSIVSKYADCSMLSDTAVSQPCFCCGIHHGVVAGHAPAAIGNAGVADHGYLVYLAVLGGLGGLRGLAGGLLSVAAGWAALGRLGAGRHCRQ